MMHVSPVRRAPAQGPLLIDVARDPAAIVPIWRSFEQANPGQLFQRFDWIAGWSATQGAALGVEPAIVTVSDANGAPLALMPFGVRRWRAVNFVEWLGGEHASFNAPLIQNGGIPSQDSESTRQLLRDVAVAIGDVDAFALTNQPRVWRAATHPFAGIGDSPLLDKAYERALRIGGDAFVDSLLDKDARKKLRAKEKRLAEFGAVRFRRSESVEEIEKTLDAFLAQRAARFRQTGIANPFAEPGAEEFLRRATSERAIALYSLSAGDRIVAIFGGPEDGARFSGMFTSFDDQPEIARNSPGDILLRHLIADLSRRGVATIDLGVGDARYKRTYCDVGIEMFETHLACTPAGALASAALRARAAAKRIVKNHPALLSLARRMTRR